MFDSVSELKGWAGMMYFTSRSAMEPRLDAMPCKRIFYEMIEATTVLCRPSNRDVILDAPLCRESHIL